MPAATALRPGSTAPTPTPLPNQLSTTGSVSPRWSSLTAPRARPGSGAGGPRCGGGDQGEGPPAKRPLGGIGGIGRRGRPEDGSVGRSLPARPRAAPEEGDDRGRYCNDGSACEHFGLLLPIGWDEAETQSKSAAVSGNDELPK